jgi:hypothetical protein
MAWQLQNRLGTLPGVLAGPILRQVTPTSVSVWFAMQYNAEVTVTLYDFTNSSDTTHSIAGASAQASQVGKSLYFVVVTVPVITPLLENKIYAYDATFSWINNPKANKSQQLLDATGLPREKLCYGSYPLPTFCLPPADLNKLRIFHGSCRKPHGEGKDALSLLDGILDANATTPYSRPHQLLLTGDQIYADDVADVLLLMLNDAGETLLGWSETLPFPKEVDGPYTASQLASYKRYPILRALGFTSDDLKSHLLSLGEYLAMYLFVWSDTLWPSATDFPGYNDVETWLLQCLPASSADQVKKDLYNQRITEITNEQSHVQTFLSTIPQVRRILANIPTYMICDDHEVTDDWNMTRWFCDQIYSTDIGIRVVQNALAAFAICQAWGNQPDRFAASTPGAALLNLFATINSASNPAAVSSDYDQYSAQIQVILGIHDSAAIESAGRVFHEGANKLVNKAYTNPTSLRYDFRVEGPGHVILVTDTRTWRAYPDTGEFTHADHLGSFLPDSELSHQVYVPDQTLGARILIVVVTTNAPPIASFRFAADHPKLVDVAQHKSDFLKEVGSTAIIGPIIGPVVAPSLTSPNPYGSQAGRAIYVEDLFDGWQFPSDALDRLIVQIDTLLKVQGQTQQAVILSGDVHSAFAARLTYWVEKQRFGDPAGTQTTSQMVLTQLVASAFKNEKDDIRGQHKSGYEYAPSWFARRIVPTFMPEGYAGWNRSGKHTSDRLNNLPVPPWNIPQLTIAKPDYRYRLDYLVTSETGQNAPPPKIFVPPSDPATALKNYAAAAVQQRLTTNTGSPNQQIIGHNNIAELSFIWQANLKRVYHTLYWIMKNPDKNSNYSYDSSSDVYVNYWSRYDVSLNLDDPDYPKITAAHEQ